MLRYKFLLLFFYKKLNFESKKNTKFSFISVTTLLVHKFFSFAFYEFSNEKIHVLLIYAEKQKTNSGA